MRDVPSLSSAPTVCTIRTSSVRTGTNQPLELPFPERPVRPNSFNDGSDTAAVTSHALGGQYGE